MLIFFPYITAEICSEKDVQDQWSNSHDLRLWFKTGLGNKQKQIQRKTLINFKFRSGQELVRFCSDWNILLNVIPV